MFFSNARATWKGLEKYKSDKDTDVRAWGLCASDRLRKMDEAELKLKQLTGQVDALRDGSDVKWDIDRVLRVDRVTTATQQARGVKAWVYSLDFNERCPNVAYLLDFLAQIRAKSPDAFTRIQMQEELLRIWQAERTTLVLVTHDIEEAVFLGDRVVVLGNRPGTVRRVVPVDLPRPRDRTSWEQARRPKRVAQNWWAAVACPCPSGSPTWKRSRRASASASR